WSARSPASRSTSAGSSRISRSAGSVASSPAWARASRSCNSSAGEGGLASLVVFFAPDTSFPPLSLVLVEARCHEGDAGQEISQVVEFDQRGVEGVQLGFRGAERRLVGFPLLPLQGVELGGQFGDATLADVLAHDAAVDLVNAVVVAPLPRHVVVLPRGACPTS